MVENDRDESCYVELVEKCNKALQMQNKFDQMYNLPKDAVGVHHQKDLKDIANAKLCRDTESKNNYEVSTKRNDHQEYQRLSNNTTADVFSDTSLADGLFFARPVNVCSDYEYQGSEESKDAEVADRLGKSSNVR